MSGVSSASNRKLARLQQAADDAARAAARHPEDPVARAAAGKAMSALESYRRHQPQTRPVP